MSFDRNQLASMTLGALVELYNRHAEKPIRKFRDKPTAVNRVLDVLPEEEPSPEKVSNGTRSGIPTSLEREALKEVKEPREGSKRHALLLLLEDGATLEEVQNDARIGWDRRTALEGIRLLHSQCGYGLELRDGKLYATT